MAAVAPAGIKFDENYFMEIQLQTAHKIGADFGQYTEETRGVAKTAFIELITEVAENVMRRSVMSSVGDQGHVPLSDRAVCMQSASLQLFYVLKMLLDGQHYIKEEMDKVDKTITAGPHNVYALAYEFVERSEVKGPESRIYHAFTGANEKLEFEGGKYEYLLHENVVHQAMYNKLQMMAGDTVSTDVAKAAELMREENPDSFSLVGIDISDMFTRTEIEAPPAQ
jgi:hypothetical protein